MVECVAGGKDLYAAPEPHVRNFYPSIVEYIPTADSKTKNEFGRLEARTPSDISISILLICIFWLQILSNFDGKFHFTSASRRWKVQKLSL